MVRRPSRLRRLAPAAVLASLAGCLSEFPEREGVVVLDATPTPDVSRLPPELGVGPSQILPQSLDVVFTPRDAEAPAPGEDDALGPDPMLPDAASEVEVCDGMDNDEDGKTDEGANAECAARDAAAPFCVDGACKACVPGTNDGCGRGFHCLADRERNICAQCTPEANTCPGESPYCDPELLVCLACPEIVLFGSGNTAERCHGPPYDGVCPYLFHVPPNTPANCADLCASLGMGCRRGFVAEDDPDEDELCSPQGEAGCVNDRLGELICDCIQ